MLRLYGYLYVFGSVFSILYLCKQTIKDRYEIKNIIGNMCGSGDKHVFV